ncbi:MAG: DUF2339 domain-containing protein [Pseudomonadota bacterium]
MWLLGLSIGGFIFFTAIILPWVSRNRIQDTQAQLAAMKKQLQELFAFLEKTGVNLPPEITSPPKIWPWQQQASASSVPASAADTPSASISFITTPEPSTPDREPGVAPQKPALPSISFEQQFGAQLPVWIGGVALALAGLFLVKYSIEMGLLSPTVRVVLGMIFGGGLLCAADWVRKRPNFANGTRIAQALCGAGIADLYVCLFAATNLYDLIPASVGFTGMAAVTAAAVWLSLRHGMAVAVLGLVGGFLTPALVGSHNPQAPILFLYLYFVLTGFMAVSRKKGWWALAIPTVLSAFLWVCLWLFGSNFTPGDSIYLGLFLMAVSATVVASSKQQYNAERADITDRFKVTSALNYLSLGGALLLMGSMTIHAGFGVMEWVLFGMLSLGGIGLAYGNQKLYGLVPWISMAVNAVMLLTWYTADNGTLAMTIALFGAMYIASGYVLQSRSEKPLLWAGLTCAASLGYYLLGYTTLHATALFADIPSFWGILALGFAILGIYSIKNILAEVPADHPQKQQLLAMYAATGTAFLSLALTIELPREFLSVAFALQLLAIAWINAKIDVSALRVIAAILGCVFGFLLLPQIVLLIQLTAYSLIEAKLALQHGVPLVDWPLFQLGVPAACFVAASYMLRQGRDDRLVRGLEIAAIGLIAVMGYYLTRHAFHADENILFVTAGFIERGVITNTLFVYGITCLWVGRQYARQAVSLSGLALVGIALFRITYFDLIAYNPLWSAQTVGALPILNALLLTYGLPMLWTWRATQELPHLGKSAWVRYGQGCVLLLAFVLLSLSVRQLFHGTYLNGSETSNAEIYSYSVAWLLFGVGLLFYGTLRADKMIRIASLAVMILTVGKVFLYDASELEGLFRVFSFFGLGLSLLGLSWFYTRFVFGERDLFGGNK